MSTFVEVEDGVSEIQALGGAVDQSTIESAILRAFPKSFSSFVTSWTFLDVEKLTLATLKIPAFDKN